MRKSDFLLSAPYLFLRGKDLRPRCLAGKTAGQVNAGAGSPRFGDLPASDRPGEAAFLRAALRADRYEA